MHLSNAPLQVAGLVTVDLLSSSTSTHVHSFSLARSQTMQMAVLCKPREGVFQAPPALRGRPAALGSIHIQVSPAHCPPCLDCI